MFSRKPSPELEAVRQMTDEIAGHERERKAALERLLQKLAPKPDRFGWPLKGEA